MNFLGLSGGCWGELGGTRCKRKWKEVISWTTLRKRHFVFQNERVFNKKGGHIRLEQDTITPTKKEKYDPSCKVILVCVGLFFEYEQNLVPTNYNNYNW